MSLFLWGVCILGVVLGGLILLVLYSQLVMYPRDDEYLDQMEMEMLKSRQGCIKGEKTEILRAPVTSDAYRGGIT
jgi:hypothetical protein